MIDLLAAPKRIQELMIAGHTIDEAVVEADHAGISITYHVSDDGDVLTMEFYHRSTKLRWLARFSGYDAETVEVFGLVSQWEA